MYTILRKLLITQEVTSKMELLILNNLAGDSINIPEIDVQLRSETIAAKTRKLKAQWTPEFSQDLNAFHSLDAEAELTNILSEYISLEIDLEILDMLVENVPTSQVANWSAKVGEEINTAGTGFDFKH